MKLTTWIAFLALVALPMSAAIHEASAAVVPVVADAELRENPDGEGIVQSTGNNGTSINARYNNNDRNEWIALKFDLSAYPNKALLTDVALNAVMHRSNSNNTKNLAVYAISPGTAGEDWDETTITYGDMPGITFDMDSTTNTLDVGGALVDLGTFGVSGVETKGDTAVINPTSLTDLVQNMGSNNLLSVLMTTSDVTNGQLRIASKEATSLDGGDPTGDAGDFGAYLTFSVVPEPASGLLMVWAAIALAGWRRRY